MWLVLLLMSVGSLLAGHASTPPVVSFAAYANSLLDRSESNLQPYDPKCYHTMAYTTSNDYCHFAPATGMLSRVEVFIQQGMIRTLDFTICDNALKLGDLILLWGKPTEAIRYRGVWRFRWGNTINVRTRYADTPSPLLSVVNVYVTSPLTQPASPNKDS